MAPASNPLVASSASSIGAQCYDPCERKSAGCFAWSTVSVSGLICEFFGTLFVCFFTAIGLSTLYWLSGNRECCGAGAVEAALVAGAALYVAVKTLGWNRVSHFNPATTLAFLFANRVSLIYAILLMIVQFAAGIVAGGFMRAFFYAFDITLGTPVPAAGFSETRAFWLEWLAVFFITLHALVREKRGKMSAIAYGGSTFVAALVLQRFTGASLNPARQLGLAIFSGVGTSWWVYYLAAFTAAATAFVVYWIAILGYKQEVAAQLKKLKGDRTRGGN